MHTEMIEAVRAAEAEAESIRRAACEDAKVILADAEESAVRITARSREEGEKTYREIVESALSDAEADCAAIEEDVQTACKKLAQNAQMNMEKAVDVILRKVVDAT